MRTDATIPVGGARLTGTLTTPDAPGPHPCALLINGSGPLDRDSAMPGMALGLGPALSTALAGVGCTTFRYDKRGVGESEGDFQGAGFDVECADAAAVLGFLRTHQAVDPDRVLVVGHSTGAVVAARLRADGYVLLACAAQPGAQVMAWQSERIAAGMAWPLRSVFRRRQARERRRISTMDRSGQVLPDRWLREYMAHDPRPDLGAIDRPVLAITGAKDVQVDPGDVARIGELVTGAFDGRTPEDLTHLLRRDPGPPGLRSYPAQLSRPVDPGLLESVAEWVCGVG